MSKVHGTRPPVGGSWSRRTAQARRKAAMRKARGNRAAHRRAGLDQDETLIGTSTAPKGVVWAPLSPPIHGTPPP